jgi:hypothetical protein
MFSLKPLLLPGLLLAAPTQALSGKLLRIMPLGAKDLFTP